MFAYVCACVCAEAAFASNECVFPPALHCLKASLKSLTTRIHRQPVTDLLQVTVMDRAVLDVDFSHSRSHGVSQKTPGYGWWPWPCSSVWSSLFLSFFLSLSLFFFGSPRQTGHLTGHSPIYPSFLSPILIAISCPLSLPPVLFTPNLPSLWSLSRHVWLICSDDTGRLLCVFVCQNASALISLMPALACFEAQGTKKALFLGMSGGTVSQILAVCNGRQHVNWSFLAPCGVIQSQSVS